MKIIGSDFDGTLNYGGVDAAKCEAIRQWREAGNLFGLVSGRGPLYLTHLREQYPALEMDFLAAYNGAVIVDSEGKTRRVTPCAEVDPRELTAALHDLGCPFVFVNGENSYTVRKDGDRLGEGEIPLSALPVGMASFLQISVQLKTEAKAAAVVDKLSRAYGRRLNPLQNGVCIDIVAPAVNKAYGLRQVAALFGGREEDVIAVGDNVNDLDMICAFHSYAMKNGVESVKRAAHRTVDSVTEMIRLEMETQ